jgi:hypothetical protein
MFFPIGHCVVCPIDHCVVCPIGHCVVCPIGHCVLCPSIYGFWLPFGIFKHDINCTCKTHLLMGISSFEWYCILSGVRVMVFNATFNNISVISWRSISLVEETGLPWEKHRAVTSHWQTLSNSVVLSTLGSISQL